MADSQAWYRDSNSGQAGGDPPAQANFLHTQRDMDMRLYSAAGQEISSSTGVGNSERISWAGLPAGETIS